MSNRLTAPVLAREEGETGRRTPAAFGGGAVIGALGGLIGLGGAEFRLPLLIGAFRFAALQAVILNKSDEPRRRRFRLAVPRGGRPLRERRCPLVDHRQSAGGQLIRRMAWRRLGNAPCVTDALSCYCRSAPWDRRRAGGWTRRSGNRSNIDRPAANGGGCHCRIYHWHRRGAAWGGGRRTPNPHSRAAVRCRYQTRWQLIARGKLADDARRLCALQPGP